MNTRNLFKNIFLKLIFILLISIGFIALKSSTSLGTTEIPRVYFDGDISQMLEKSDERKITIKYESSDVNFDVSAKIKIQGTSSIFFEKKNYNITLYQDNEYKDKKKIDVGKGWGAQSKYCLKANWIDKTHSRNIVSARIAAKIQEKYGLFNDLPNNGLIDGYPVEIYSNNEFLGLYTWNIPKSDWMWGLDEDNPNNLALVGDDWTDQVLFYKEITDLDKSKWEVEIGEENQETIDKFNRLLNFVANSTDEEFKKDFELYLNKDATFNYIAMMDVMEATDNYGKNMAMVTYDGKIWYPSLYDLDSTWGTNTSGDLLDSYDYIAENLGNNLITRTIKCFANEYATRWFELRKSILKEANIIKEFEKFEDSIPKETFEKEEERWGEAIPGYDIDQIEDFLDYRLDYVDNIIKSKLDDETIAIETKEIEKQDKKNLKEKDIKEKSVEFILYGLIFIVIVSTILVYIKTK